MQLNKKFDNAYVYALRVLRPVLLTSPSATPAEQAAILNATTFEQLEEFVTSLAEAPNQIQCLGFGNIIQTQVGARARPPGFNAAFLVAFGLDRAEQDRSGQHHRCQARQGIQTSLCVCQGDTTPPSCVLCVTCGAVCVCSSHPPLRVQKMPCTTNNCVGTLFIWHRTLVPNDLSTERRVQRTLLFGPYFEDFIIRWTRGLVYQNCVSFRELLS